MDKEKNDEITFTENNPTSIVGDFRTYLTYLTTHPIKLTRTKGYFTKKDLLVIYSQMKCESSEVAQQGTQIRYPIIHLFYHLSVVLDFFKVNRKQSSAVAIIQKERIETFMKMTATEQYLTLLEAFWTETDWEELQGEEWGRAPSTIDFLFREFESIPANQEIILSKDQEIKHFLSGYGQFFHYLSYFGLWEITIDYEESNRLDRRFQTVVKSIKLTPLFKIIQPALYETWDPFKGMNENSGFGIFDILFNLPNELIEDETEEEEETESLSEILRPLFAKEEFKGILKKKLPDFKEGTYLFKVRLNPSCWRTLQLSSAHTLLDLHYLIQDAFDFDDDHLYAFYMDGKSFSKSCYNSPMDSSGPYVTEAEIGILELCEGQSFLYLFDFGDEWTFDVQVVKVIEEETNSEPKIIETFGESPEQYRW